jgi:predicted nucleic acid-binding protein
MIVYLDANIVIYHVEQPAYWGPRATARLNALSSAGEQLAVSDLHRLECLVGPLVAGDASRYADFIAFFTAPTMREYSLSAAVCERAAGIRAAHRIKALDALHLAIAVENACGRYLTSDARLARFPDVPVEVLT